MLARLRPRLTFANVCSFLALLIALGTGSAYAANTVFSTDIVDGEVKTADLDNNAVTHRQDPRRRRSRARTSAPTPSTAPQILDDVASRTPTSPTTRSARPRWPTIAIDCR